MNPREQKAASSRLSRRRFLLRGAGTPAVAAALLELRRAQAAGRGGAANPFAYSTEAFEKTDPALLTHREVARFKAPLQAVHRLALTPKGHLLVAGDQALVELSPEGRLLRRIATDGPARCAAVAADGTIYAGLRDHLEVFGPDGRRRARWALPAKRSWITGLAVTEDDLFAADSGQRVVLRYDRTGKARGEIGKRDRARGVTGFVLPSPYLDVAWGEDGLLRVNNPGRHRVEFYTPDGGLEFFWGRPGMAVKYFSGCCNPVSLALLDEGRLVTCEKGLPRVKIYRAHGELEGVVAGPESFPENLKAGAGDGLGDGTRASLDAVAAADGRVYILDTVTREIHVREPKQKTAT